jgi:two-component system, NtrC family, sensor kinase
VLELSGKELQHSYVNIERIWDPAIPLIIANPDHLKQVFLNLVINAIDAMPQGGDLSIRTIFDQDNVSIEFTDTGIGMPPEIQARLFEPFFTTKTQGSGLGLSISYGIIQEHDGQILVQSEVGKGTTFTITLPIR